jgi:MYXO-CTERM domain-containing protein
MTNFLIRSAAAAVLAGSALGAQALTLNLTGFAQGAQTVTLTQAGSAVNLGTFGAGAFTGSLSGGTGFDANPFYTYCVEVTQNFSFGSPLGGYSIVDGASYFSTNFGANAALIVQRLGRLFTHLQGISLPDDTQTSAAIQYAVWESIYETGTTASFNSGSMSSSGAFRFTANANTITEATNLLAAASAVTTNRYSISVLRNAERQDFLLIRANEVSAPGSLALVALGLVAAAGLRRRA